MNSHTATHPSGMQYEQRDSSHIGIAFIIGAAIGAISGLLIAPKSGKETRQDLQAKRHEANDMAHERLEQAKAKGRDLTDKMKHKTDRTTDRIEDKAHEAVETMSDRRPRM